ncbi:uncharacterized protein FIESC28_06195 [Fusarium coffeatum]|uniref:AttH domain-containing protein n=1 Tax=Fusarium coffeatum TaxID=231269 RepID=A0A366RLX4_9HYPO|nr:uncharacterized protein FIESC28_06195 [Fusarium coffeatum]RBR18129.1 hypothetical protein FIESC28_06195 [Fusarium coffeatum]
MTGTPLSWAPPSYPPTTIENDGDNTSHGASIIHPGSGNPDRLELKSATRNVTSPEDVDQWTNTHLELDFVGIKHDVILQPTGGNFYYGAAVAFSSSTEDQTLTALLPFRAGLGIGPASRLHGYLEIDGNRHEIDSKQSFALFKRQWGNFHNGKGYFALWFYLETGEVLISWSMEPNLDGESKTAFASVWHPNGRHEMLPVGPKSRTSEIEASPETGLKYFNKFFLDLPARDACLFHIHQVGSRRCIGPGPAGAA